MFEFCSQYKGRKERVRMLSVFRIAKYFPSLNKGHGSRHGRYTVKETGDLSPELCNNPLCQLNVKGKGGLQHRSSQIDKATDWLEARR